MGKTGLSLLSWYLFRTLSSLRDPLPCYQIYLGVGYLSSKWSTGLVSFFPPLIFLGVGSVLFPD